MPHGHKYSIADDEAEHVLLYKMLGGGTRQMRREKLLRRWTKHLSATRTPAKRSDRRFFTGSLPGMQLL